MNLSFFHKRRSLIIGAAFLSLLALFFGIVLPRAMSDGIDRSILGDVVSVESSRFTMRTQDGELAEFTIDANVQIAEDQPFLKGQGSGLQALDGRALSAVMGAGDLIRVDIGDGTVQRITTFTPDEK